MSSNDLDRNDRDRDAYFMKRALVLARRGIPGVFPNPPVGAVVVSEGKIVGRGYHRRAGEPHAEVFALAEAGERARGGTLYVTLEPCNHHGRTPPCTEAVLKAGVSRVVISCPDPNPQVPGGGRARLEEAGVHVSDGCEFKSGESLLGPWTHRVMTGTACRAVAVGRSLEGRFFVASADWTARLSRAAKRTLERQQKFFEKEGEFSLPEGRSVHELLRHAPNVIFVYILPIFLGEQGAFLEGQQSDPAEVSPQLPGMLHLVRVRKLGQTALAEYGVR